MGRYPFMTLRLVIRSAIINTKRPMQILAMALNVQEIVADAVDATVKVEIDDQRIS